MNDEQIWAIYFAGIASIRMHPRNVMLPLNGLDAETSVVKYAAAIADIMLKLHKERFPCGQQSAEQ